MGTKAVSDERRGIRISGGARVALALVVVTIAAILSWSMGTRSGAENRSPVGTNTPKPNAKWLRRWYEAHLPHWTSAPFTDLNDLPRLTETVAELVDKRFPGPEFDQKPLVRDLAVFLHAVGSHHSDEYLARIGRLREVRTDAYGDKTLHGFYRLLTGEPLPPTMNAKSLHDLFWVGDTGAISHPQELASVATIQVGRSNVLSSEQNPNHLLANRIMPDFSMFQSDETDHWVGPVAQGLPKTTRPPIELEDVIAKHKTTLMCYAFFALRNADGQVVPVWILSFFSPDEEVWYVEGFGTYHTAYVFWPF